VRGSGIAKHTSPGGDRGSNFRRTSFSSQAGGRISVNGMPN